MLDMDEVIRPGGCLAVAVSEDSSFDDDYWVRSKTGNLVMPGLPRIRVAGRTTSQVEELIAEELKVAKLVADAYVSVRIVHRPAAVAAPTAQTPAPFRFTDSELDEWEARARRTVRLAAARAAKYAGYNYYQRMPGTRVDIAPSRFWLDVVEGTMLTPYALAARRSANEVLLMLALVDLPFTAAPPSRDVRGEALILRSNTGALVASDQLLAATQLETAPEFFLDWSVRQQDMQVGNGEYVSGMSCTATITATNYSADALTLLVRHPDGSIPLFDYRSAANQRIAARSTRTFTTAFYFPEEGTFYQPPLHLSRGTEVVGSLSVPTCKVSGEDAQFSEYWPWLTKRGATAQIQEFLANANVQQLDLGLLGPRLRDRDLYEVVAGRLESGLQSDPVVGKYALFHRDERGARAFLGERGLDVGPTLESELYQVRRHQHVAYDTLGVPQDSLWDDKPPDDKLTWHYREFLNLQCYKNPTPETRLAWCYYLALQKRSAQAIAEFATIDREAFAEKLQYDYQAAWLAVAQGHAERALAIVNPYLAQTVPHWQVRFRALARAAQGEYRLGTED
ncbi:MAG TPA: hypothetical protein DCR55_07115 [Lentisphaeria bacterium]|nr:hypothetical protein [Lentisphaeria bacterium]